nr:hypothetical protein [Rhodococcus spelaei]
MFEGVGAPLGRGALVPAGGAIAVVGAGSWLRECGEGGEQHFSGGGVEVSFDVDAAAEAGGGVELVEFGVLGVGGLVVVDEEQFEGFGALGEDGGVFAAGGEQEVAGAGLGAGVVGFVDLGTVGVAFVVRVGVGGVVGVGHLCEQSDDDADVVVVGFAGVERGGDFGVLCQFASECDDLVGAARGHGGHAREPGSGGGGAGEVFGDAALVDLVYQAYAEGVELAHPL